MASNPIHFESEIDFPNRKGDVANVKADEIIAQIKALPPEDFAKVSAFMLESEQDDPALQIALQRMQESNTGQTVSRPYEEVIASVRAALDRARG